MRHVFGLTNLGSGSSGNATVIHTPGGALLVDAGFSGKELCSRLESVSVKPEEIRAVLVTHEHTDHTKGVRIFTDAYGIPCCTTTVTCKALMEKKRIGTERLRSTHCIRQKQIDGFRCRAVGIQSRFENACRVQTPAADQTAHHESLRSSQQQGHDGRTG